MPYHLEIGEWEAPVPGEEEVHAHDEFDQCLPTRPAKLARSKKFQS